MKTQRAADIVVGCFIALFGVFILFASLSITGGAAHRLPPRTFPMIVGFLLLLCGGGLALKSWSARLSLEARYALEAREAYARGARAAGKPCILIVVGE